MALGPTSHTKPAASQPSTFQSRTLTYRLRELDVDGLVVRKVYAPVPSKVEYSLSKLGLNLTRVLHALKQWVTIASGVLTHLDQRSGGLSMVGTLVLGDRICQQTDQQESLPALRLTL